MAIRVPGGTPRACSFPEEETTPQSTLAGHNAPATSVTRALLPHFPPLTTENANSQRLIPGWSECVSAPAFLAWERMRIPEANGRVGAGRAERRAAVGREEPRPPRNVSAHAPSSSSWYFRRVCCRSVQIVSARQTCSY